jgi:hypothetical protein
MTTSACPAYLIWRGTHQRQPIAGPSRAWGALAQVSSNAVSTIGAKFSENGLSQIAAAELGCAALELAAKPGSKLNFKRATKELD